MPRPRLVADVVAEGCRGHCESEGAEGAAPRFGPLPRRDAAVSAGPFRRSGYLPQIRFDTVPAEGSEGPKGPPTADRNRDSGVWVMRGNKTPLRCSPHSPCSSCADTQPDPSGPSGTLPISAARTYPGLHRCRPGKGSVASPTPFDPWVLPSCVLLATGFGVALY
jgi:hypothetical protein